MLSHEGQQTQSSARCTPVTGTEVSTTAPSLTPEARARATFNAAPMGTLRWAFHRYGRIGVEVLAAVATLVAAKPLPTGRKHARPVALALIRQCDYLACFSARIPSDSADGRLLRSVGWNLPLLALYLRWQLFLATGILRQNPWWPEACAEVRRRHPTWPSAVFDRAGQTVVPFEARNVLGFYACVAGIDGAERSGCFYFPTFGDEDRRKLPDLLESFVAKHLPAGWQEPVATSEGVSPWRVHRYSAHPDWPAAEASVRALHPDWPESAFVSARAIGSGDAPMRITHEAVLAAVRIYLPEGHPGRSSMDGLEGSAR